jgi:hypothetical protein
MIADIRSDTEVMLVEIRGRRPSSASPLAGIDGTYHWSREQLDRRLNRLLAALAHRLSETQQDQIIVQSHDLVAFGAQLCRSHVRCRLAVLLGTGKRVICDGYEQGCVIPVHHPALRRLVLIAPLSYMTSAAT